MPINQLIVILALHEIAFVAGSCRSAPSVRMHTIVEIRDIRTVQRIGNRQRDNVNASAQGAAVLEVVPLLGGMDEVTPVKRIDCQPASFERVSVNK